MSIKTVSSKLILLVALVLIFEVSINRANSLYFRKYLEETPNEISPMANEFNRHIHYMINAYREDNEKLSDTRNLGDAKYKTWKRNGDLINSLLALPKDMDEAGR